MSSLDRLFRPRSIAVVGGGSWCENVIEQSQKIGFTGDIWPVHPKRDAVGGLSAFRRVEDLPSAPDATFVGVNRYATVEVVESLSKMRAGGAVCFASGFSEADAETEDGARLQGALLNAASGIGALGPNCYGFINYLDGVALWPDQHGGKKVETGVAIITQSSNIALNLTMQMRGLPIAYIVTVGNQAQIGLSDIAEFLLRDERVTAVGIHIEGVGDLRALERMASTARALDKPVVALKIGKSDAARAATISHTAALTGSAAGSDALLARLGIGQVSTLPVFLESLKLLHAIGPLPSNRIVSLSCSGGEAALVADGVDDTGLDLPPLDKKQENALRKALGPKVSLANPLDYHTYSWSDEDALTETFSAMMLGDIAIGCVILDFPRADRCDITAWEPVIHAVQRAQAASGKPVAIVSSLPETLPEEMLQRLDELGVVGLCGLDDALTAIDVAATLGKGKTFSQPLLLPTRQKPGPVLSEREAKTKLANYGVPIPKHRYAASRDELERVAQDLHFPVVLKGEGFAHKTEAGAVALNLNSAEALKEAAQIMRTPGYLVEEMASDHVAELLVGIVSDPAHGYVLTLAAGGTLTEILDDRASLLIPSDRAAIIEALQRLKIAKLLNGYRGRPAANLDSVVDCIMALQRYVETERPIEVEINPLICGVERAVAVDALIQEGIKDD